MLDPNNTHLGPLTDDNNGIVGTHASAPLPESTIETKVGCLWLRVADQRDVFFAELVERSLPLHDLTKRFGIQKPTLGSGELWMDGTKDEFFELDVDIDNTIIEGFYIDEFEPKRITDYEITIYLEVEIKEEDQQDEIEE